MKYVTRYRQEQLSFKIKKFIVLYLARSLAWLPANSENCFIGVEMFSLTYGTFYSVLFVFMFMFLYVVLCFRWQRKGKRNKYQKHVAAENTFPREIDELTDGAKTSDVVRNFNQPFHFSPSCSSSYPSASLPCFTGDKRQGGGIKNGNI
jgi:hypothetical protein